MSFVEKVLRITKKKSFRYSVPFLICVVGGSFYFKEFTQIRYQYSKKQAVNPEDMEKAGIPMKPRKEVTIDKEYEKIKTIDIDNWENKRGPRPWEEATN